MKDFNQKWTVQDWIDAVNEESSESVDAITESFSLSVEKYQKIKAIVGESPYPNNPLTVKNGYFGFPEIAFFKTEYSLDMVSILGILFDSMDDGIKFLKGIKGTNNLFRRNSLIAFSALLFLKERIILINRNDSNSQYQKVIFSKIVPYLDKILIVGKTKQTKNFRKDIKNIPYLSIIHPSHMNYASYAPECCHTYFERIINPQNGVSLSDFKIV